MNPLRQKLIDAIDLRGRSAHTRRAYVECIARLARFHQRSPDQLSDEEVQGYLLHLLRQEKLSASSLVVAVSALRFFYEHVLQKPPKVIEHVLPRPKLRSAAHRSTASRNSKRSSRSPDSIANIARSKPK